MEVFRKRLKELRKKHGLTQNKLGNLVNVTKVSISGYENGNRTPNIETLIDIADALGVTIDYLLGREINLVSEDSEEYKIKVSDVDLKILQEIKKYPNLYNNLVNNLENTVKLIDKKLKK
ncbi:MAG TPA: helix-turn-helix transcriptional regulator [Tenericutes bacterium]|jgi:transcriptional regulator with XRE-family HTH domain|nr:helix-turn-helix transcriptional regulator [Mycoplasmatota bacterium]